MSRHSIQRFVRICLVIAVSSTSSSWVPFELVSALLLPSLYSSITVRRFSGNRWKWHDHSTSWLSRQPTRLDKCRLPLSALSLPEESDQKQKYWKLPRLYVGPRYNTDKTPSMTPGATVPLSSEQVHYLINVMRILKKRKNNRRKQEESGSGDNWRDCIRVFNGADGEWLARVHVQQNEPPISSKGISKRRGRSGEEVSLVAECITQLRPQDLNKDERPQLLFVPLKKQPRVKHMIEKCTELGVGSLIPVASDRMEGDASLALIGSVSQDAMVYGHSQENDGVNERFGKLELQAIEASEQCERLDIPFISSDVGLTVNGISKGSLWRVQELITQWSNNWEANQQTEKDRNVEEYDGDTGRVILICRERGSEEDADNGRARVVPLLQALRNNRRVSFLVGPEGGWSEEEEEVFDQICSKFSGRDDAPVQCVSLGSSVLRAETACMMAVGAWALAHDS